MAISNWTSYGNGKDAFRPRHGETQQSFRRLQGEMNRLFENFFGGSEMQTQPWDGLAIPSENNINMPSHTTTRVSSPQMTSPQVANPQIGNRQMGSPQMTNPQVGNRQVGSPQVSNRQWSNQQFNRSQPVNRPQQFNPRIEVTEDAKTLHVMAELPGIETSDIELFCNENSLTITGEKRDRTMEGAEGGDFLQTERAYRFRRSIPFNVNVDTENAEATFENGVLHVQLRKAGASQGTRLEIK